MTAAAKTYVVHFSLAMVAYMIILIGSLTLLNTVTNPVWRVPLAVAPVIPVVFALLAFLRYLHQMDELQQRIQLVAVGFACGMTGLLTFTYGFLELIGFPHLALIWILPLMIALWGIGTGIASWKYR